MPKAIPEPIPYTAEELDTILDILSDEPKLDTSGTVKKMIIFTTNLQALLLREGINYIYHPNKKDSSQSLELELGDGSSYKYGDYNVVVRPGWLYLHLPNIPFHKDRLSVSGVLSLLQGLQQDIVKHKQLYLVRQQCIGCYYTDTLNNYCGLGLNRELECTNYKAQPIEYSYSAYTSRS